MSYTTTATIIITLLLMTLLVKNVILFTVNKQNLIQKALIILTDLSAFSISLYFYLVVTNRIFFAPYFLYIGGFAFACYSMFPVAYMLYTTKPTRKIYIGVLSAIVFILLLSNLFLNELDFLKRIDLVYMGTPSIKSVALLRIQLILSIVASILCLNMIKHTHIRFELANSSTQKFQFSWLSLQFKCLIGVSLFIAVFFTFAEHYFSVNEFTKEISLMILFYAVVLVPTFGCLKQAPISEDEIAITNEIELKFSEAVANNPANTENENFEEYEKIVNSVIKYVKDESLYLDADLKLNSLSDKCNIPSYQISKSINFILNKNFNEFINDFRIIESKRKLSSAEFEHVTILAIALESGFNSKSSFNAQFKKRENTTPNEFRSTHSSK